jgi:PKD repeat protein/subtilisin family serine protease
MLQHKALVNNTRGKVNFQKPILIFLCLCLSLFFGTPVENFAQTSYTERNIIVDREVLSEIHSSGTASFWVNFRKKADLSPAYGMEWSERGRYVYEELAKDATSSQAELIDYLTSNGIPHQSFWIKNTVYVKNSGIRTLNNLQNFKGIESIELAREFVLVEPVESEPATRNSTRAIEPNIARIKADQAWALGINGSGLVVANIDTGVRFSHETLVNQYRGNEGGGIFSHDYNWYDPHRNYPAYFNYFDVPADPNGHGTHVMGTSVGDGGGMQIGVAPDADWFACRGCYGSSCYDFALLTCGQFLAAPTRVDGTDPNADLRPHVVNNSWGGNGEYNDWYQDVVDNWHALGIFPVFANGNAGAILGNVGNPARYGNVTGVGATTQSTGELALFSSWGPTDNPDNINPTMGYTAMKPQVAAPGASILSASPGSDSSYQYMSGTSMASPHVAGLVALMWQAGSCLTGNYAVTENLIEHTAWPIEYNDGSPDTGLYPNYATGWGEIDVLAAIQAAKGYCAESSLEGVVTDQSSGTPIEGASVEISNSEGFNLRSYSQANGSFVNSVEMGSFDLTASKYGYFPETVNNVSVSSSQAVSRDFSLQRRPTLTITGTVYDGGVFGGDSHGHPLPATINLAASGFSQVINTDPTTGYYQVELFQDVTYSIIVSSSGYDTLIGTFSPDSNPYLMDYYLYVSLPACSAYGYGYEGGSLFEPFETGQLPSGWANVDYEENGQVWTFDNPGDWPNYSGEGGFADLNSYYYHSLYGPGQVQNAGLRTRPLDFSSATGMDVRLRFNTDFYLDNHGYETATIKVSRNGGETWSTVWTEEDDLWFAYVELDITAEAAGAEALTIEFLYEGTDGGAWQVDNVHVTAGECMPLLEAAVSANFIATPNSGAAPLQVQFNNQSSGDYDSCVWAFGDGNSLTSCDDLNHTYTSAGTYIVSLTVSGPGGEDEQEDHINVYESVLANFSAAPNSGAAPLTVDFTNQSEGDFDTCMWNFGDWNDSDQCDPSHTYTSAGTYTVSLTVSGPGGEDEQEDHINVYEPVQANFSAAPNSGAVPLLVQFNNQSSGDYDSCVWAFGDGNSLASCDDHSHTYTSTGTYSVSLTVSGPGGEDEQEVIIQVFEEEENFSIFLPLVFR